MAASSTLATREMRKRRNKTGPPNSTASKISKSDQHFELPQSEEDEALLRNPDNDLSLFCEAIKSMKKLMKEILSLKLEKSDLANAEIVEKKTQVSMLFIVLKKLNRLDKFRCQRATDQIQEAMQKVDSIHLKLQNLHYETVHLKKEITKCFQFKSLNEEINLVPLEEFHKEAPEDIKRSPETQNDEHQLNLARLQWELQQRKELAKKLTDSQKKQEKVLEEITKKQSYLENLRPTLKSILKAAQPLQDELGVPLLASESFHNMAKHLPQPLCVLFVQSSAYHEACDKKMTVEVQGDVEEAITWKESEDVLEEDSDSDAEDDGKRKRHRRNTFNKVDNRKKKLLQKHPLHVKIIISLSDSESITLLFYYLVSLHIVTVDIAVCSPATSVKSGDVLSSSSVLNCLFPLDTGNDTPNPTNHFQLEKVGLGQFSDYITECGYPYQWVQRICGLSFETMTHSSNHLRKGSKSKDVLHSLSSKNVEVTISSIRSRLRSRLALHQQLAALEKGSIPVPKSCAHLFCPKIISRLTSWKIFNWNEFKILPWTEDLLEASIVDSTDFIFCATLERSSAKMSAYVILSQDYPKTTPFFKLDISYRGKYSSFNDIHVRDMEREMNIYTEEFIQDCPRNQILVNLVEKLRMCFDIYLETAAMQVSNISEGPCEFPKEKVFIQSSRGKDHCRPYKFLPKIGVFTHR